MTGNPSVASSIEALRVGAWDYLPKPFSATHLQVLVGRASHAVLVTRETKALRQQLVQQNGNSDKITLLGVAPAFRKAVELARKVAPTDASVMITGESGTGKEVIAQFIHQHSRRASRKLVPINCAALPEPLLECEMFGHRKGAFTGADRDKPGLLETANGGTLFLDELTEMSLPLQAKLLRVLQDGVVRRVGSEQQDATVDVRFVSATNRDPQEAVNAGILREDLFYRLRVVPITLPPLRERDEDIAMLANHFLAYFWERHREAGDTLAASSPTTAWSFCARASGAGTCASCRTSSSTSRCSRSRGSRFSRRTFPRTKIGNSSPARSTISSAHHGRAVPRGEGPADRRVRARVSLASLGARGRQHVARGAAREHRSHDALPPHGKAQRASRRADGESRVTAVAGPRTAG